MERKFKNPPINELVIGVFFEREIAELRSEHVGVFWSGVRQEFPTISQQVGISQPVTTMMPGFTIEMGSPGEIYPMPRFWLESADGTFMMQIQKNAFLFNWRKREAAYPHFDIVKEGFDKQFSRLITFFERELKIQTPAIQIADLNYINLIKLGDYWKGPNDTSNVIPSFRLPVADLPASKPPDFNQVAVQRFSPVLSVTTSIKSGRNAATQEPVLLIELRAIGPLGSVHKTEADDWFAEAHSVVNDCFIGMTNPDIRKRYWEEV